jgi:hypothetical protein
MRKKSDLLNKYQQNLSLTFSIIYHNMSFRYLINYFMTFFANFS